MSVEGLIKEGLDHFAIPHTSVMVEKLSFFMQELERWNTHVNLTARHPVEWMIRELLCDTFFLFAIIRGASSALDVGSGSGILAIPIAILDGPMQLFSVDRTLGKIQFQRHIKRSLGLTGLTPIHGRIEGLEPLAVDVLLAKGFGPAAVILGKAGLHLKGGGFAYLLKGRTEKESIHSGFSLEQVLPYRLPGSSKGYRLFVYKKVS
jgi:16S rRNA (guanine527-N7)-methyltransferase